MKRIFALTILFLATTASLAAQSSDPLDERYRPSINGSDVPSNIWITGVLAKVQPSEQPGNRKTVELAAARNEVESFQVHVRAGAVPIVLDVQVSDLTNL